MILKDDPKILTLEGIVSNLVQQNSFYIILILNILFFYWQELISINNKNS